MRDREVQLSHQPDKVHGYIVVFTAKLSKKSTPKKTMDDDVDNTNSKTAKREEMCIRDRCISCIIYCYYQMFTLI